MARGHANAQADCAWGLIIETRQVRVQVLGRPLFAGALGVPNECAELCRIAVLERIEHLVDDRDS